MLQWIYPGVRNLARAMRLLSTDSCGATSIEYGLVAGLIAVAVISAAPVAKAQLGLVVSEDNRAAVVQLLDANDGNRWCRAPTTDDRASRSCPAVGGTVQGNSGHLTTSKN